MHKKVLTEVDLYYGEVAMPKGFEIDRNRIKNDILKSFVTSDRINNNPQSYSYKDYKVPFSQPLQWMQDYIRDHWRVEYERTLVPQTICANILHPKEQSWTRHRVDPVDLRHSPDYTLIYGVNVNKDSSKCIVEYDDNRRKNRTWQMPIKNNHFIMFPANNRYSISPNTSNGLNIILTINYEYI